MSEEVNGNAAEGYTTPTKEAASQRSYSEPLPLPPSDEIDQEVLRAVQQSQDPNLDVLLPKLGARMSSGVGMGGGTSPSAVGGSEVPGGTKKDSTDQGRSGEGTFEELQAKTAGQLSVRDLHTDENSPADIALKAASTKKGRQKGLSTGASTVGTREKGEAADDDDADMMPEGNEITEEHAQYALSYGMMLGIRVTQGRRKIGECEEHLHQEPSTEEYEKVTKMNFPPEGSNHPPNITPPHRLEHAFKFKDYSPDVFRKIRRHFGIGDADYMLSLCGDFNYIEFQANSKSGQFFFYSHDGRYMIKTQTKEEGKFLRKLLPSYYEHLKNNNSSLMTRFYGMHRVKMKHINKKMRFVVMASVFHTPLPIHKMFDLKGSTVGREATPEERERNAVMKDNDLTMDNVVMKLGRNRDVFINTLREDSLWLAKHNIMDYSLLLGIHYDDHQKDERHAYRTASVQLTDKEIDRQLQMLNDGGIRVYSEEIEELGEGEGDEGAANGEGGETPEQLEFVHKARRAKRGSNAISAAQDRRFSEASGLANNVFAKDKGGIREMNDHGAEGDEVYFLGIIDILQQYNKRKAAENFIKGFKFDRKLISAVHPNWYAERFVQFMSKNSK